jgi:mannosyltransferase
VDSVRQGDSGGQSLSVNPRPSEQVPGRVPGTAAGGPDSGAIGADENAAGRRPGAAQPGYGGSPAGSQGTAAGPGGSAALPGLSASPVPRAPVALQRAAARERVGAAAAFVVAGGMFSWRVGSASAWRDEAVTQDVAGRSVGQLFALCRHVDVVHLAYYLLAHVVHLGGGDFVALRLLSVLLFAAATAVTVLVGAELGSLRHGLFAAALVVASPFASSYAQQARSYALTTFVATLSVWALLVAVRREGVRRWAGYGLTVVACGLSNAVSLLVLLSHAVAVMAGPRAQPPRWVLPPRLVLRVWTRPVPRAWAVAAGTSVLVLSGFLGLALRQSGQVGWLTRPGVERLVAVLCFDLGPRLLLAELAAVALVVSLVVPQLRVPWLITASWGFGPVLALWLGSQAHPLFDGRYVAFCLPGAALALTTPVRLRVGRGPQPWREWAASVTAAALVAALAVGAWPGQLRVRGPSGVEDLRGVADILRENARSGSAVLFLPSNLRLSTTMYADGLPPLRDLSLKESGRASATLAGVDRTPDDVRARLATEPLVWVVTRTGHVAPHSDTGRTELAAVQACFTGTGDWTVRAFRVRRFVRALTSPACSS